MVSKLFRNSSPLALRSLACHSDPKTRTTGQKLAAQQRLFCRRDESLIGGRACRVTATIREAKDKMKATGFEPLVFEDAQDLLLDQLGAIHGRDCFLQY